MNKKLLKYIMPILVIISILFVGKTLANYLNVQEDFNVLNNIFGLNKPVGNTFKNKKNSSVPDNMNQFLKNDDKNSKDKEIASISKKDIQKKIEDLKVKIKNNKIKIKTEQKTKDNDRKDLIKNKNSKKNKKPEAFMTPSKLGGMGTCRFLPSDTCSKEYPVYMGASLGIPDNSGMKLKCNSDLTKPAKGLAIINKGKLEAIVLLDKGEGYKVAPKITIEGGGGKNAECISYIDGLGSINKIEVSNPGYNYTGTPKVNIELPSTSSSCFLCCKKLY